MVWSGQMTDSTVGIPGRGGLTRRRGVRKARVKDDERGLRGLLLGGVVEKKIAAEPGMTLRG